MVPGFPSFSVDGFSPSSLGNWRVAILTHETPSDKVEVVIQWVSMKVHQLQYVVFVA